MQLNKSSITKLYNKIIKEDKYEESIYKVQSLQN